MLRHTPKHRVPTGINRCYGIKAVPHGFGPCGTFRQVLSVYLILFVMLTVISSFGDSEYYGVFLGAMIIGSYCVPCQGPSLGWRSALDSLGESNTHVVSTKYVKPIIHGRTVVPKPGFYVCANCMFGWFFAAPM